MKKTKNFKLIWNYLKNDKLRIVTGFLKSEKFERVLSNVPILQIGLPAILSIYFDVFSGCLQAFIFAMLTMLYVASGFPEEDYFARKAKKLAKSNNIK